MLSRCNRPWKDVRVEESLLDYALEIVERTRQTEQLSLGVSTRGALMLHRAAQARAFLQGRDFCLPDDFKQLVVPVFAHRVVVNTRYVSTQKKSEAGGNILREIGGNGPRAALMARSFKDARHRSNPSFSKRIEKDLTGWRSFAIAMVALALAFGLAIYSGAAAQTGARLDSPASALAALGLAGWVAVTIVPALARRTPLRWLTYHVSYRVTREGIVYLAGIFIVALAALNTGNNLTFSGSRMHARGNCAVGNSFAYYLDGHRTSS